MRMVLSLTHSPSYIRASNCATLPACHSPTPRGVRMPRRFNSAAMARRLRAPVAGMSGRASVGARLDGPAAGLASLGSQNRAAVFGLPVRAGLTGFWSP
jgi:hypothetical protein